MRNNIAFFLQKKFFRFFIAGVGQRGFDQSGDMPVVVAYLGWADFGDAER